MTKAAPRTTPRRRAAQPGTIDLALQGGGSHGAFTWGVLDALLEDGRLTLDGISGTSAGAMNAAVLASGWAQGGREGARHALRDFWHAVGGSVGCWGGAHVPATALPAWAFNRGQWPGMALFSSWMQLWSPYQLNPLNLDPLRNLIQSHVSIDAIRQGALKVFITATSVRTGQPRVFEQQEVSIEALLASACLPQIAQTVVIDGEPYWDGGFSGNPALWPLIYGTETDDVLLVQINPRVRDGIPRSATDIADRVNEITFNAALVAEMRAIAFVQKLLAQDRLDPTRYKRLRMHRIADEDGLAPFDASSKLNTDLRLLLSLFELGRQAAHSWLAGHISDVGERSSMDITETYLSAKP